MSQSHRQPLVFVVDDEHIIASTLAMILRSQGGFEARAFTMPLDASEAAQLSYSGPPRFRRGDAALSEIDPAIQVRQHCPDCKVLLFSGQAATAGLLEAARGNGYNFKILWKPVHPSDLLEKIRNLTEPRFLHGGAEVYRAEVAGSSLALLAIAS